MELGSEVERVVEDLILFLATYSLVMRKVHYELALTFGDLSQVSCVTNHF